VQVNKKPQVSFNFAGKPCTDSSFSFTPAVTANGNTIQNGFWSFGDGQTQTVNHANAVTHAYNSPVNNVAVKLVISGGTGCDSDTALQTIAGIHPAPDAAFSIAGNSFCPEKDIVFNYTGTSVIQSWWWDFVNGVSSAAAPVNHRFNDAGIYAVSITVKTAEGCGAVPITQQLTIYSPPNIDAGPGILKVAGQAVVINAVPQG